MKRIILLFLLAAVEVSASETECLKKQTKDVEKRALSVPFGVARVIFVEKEMITVRRMCKQKGVKK